MKITQTNCSVVVPDDLSYGDFANAFRVVRDGSETWLLDFCVFSPSENKARVVARVRVLPGMVPAIQATLSDSMDLLPTNIVPIIGSDQIH